MRQFTDDKGDAWEISVNVWTLKQVNDRVDVLLTRILDDNADLFAKLYSDPILLCDVAWVLVEDQAKERDVGVKDFCLRVMGDALGTMRTAVLESTVDFFDDPVTRENHREAMAKYLQIANKINRKASDLLEHMDIELEAKKVSDYVLSTRVSSGFGPGLSPSVN